MVAVERNEQASRELPVGVRREVADTTDPAAAKGLIDRVDGEVGPGRAGEHHRHVPPRRRAQYDPEMLLLMIDVNLGPALWLSQAVAGASHAAAGLGVPSCTWSPVRGSSHPAASRPTA